MQAAAPLATSGKQATEVPTSSRPQQVVDRPAPTGYSYFPETPHSVTEFARPFADFGGVAGLGLPLTEAFVVTSMADGKQYWVQYFEKGVLEYHADLPAEKRYQVAPLGTLRFQSRYGKGGTTLPSPKQLPGDASYLFKETNQTVRVHFSSSGMHPAKCGGSATRSAPPSRK